MPERVKMDAVTRRVIQEATADALARFTGAGERIHDAIAGTPVNVNEGRRTCMLRWNEIPPSAWRDELERTALGYGYEEPELAAA